MKGQMMKKFKSVLMAGLASGMLLTAGTGMAAGEAAKYIGIGANALAGGLGFFGSAFTVLGVNIDILQTATEYMVLEAMKETTFVWEPEPEKEYQKAADNNGGSDGSGNSNGGLVPDLTPQQLPFVVASLKNVGIEAIDVGPALGDIATDETRTKILGELEFLQPKTAAGSTANTTNNDTPGAGDCTASYSVCLKDMTDAEQEEIVARQKQNEQNFGTAGITHAELGLKAVQQAMVNDGAGAVGQESVKAASEDAEAAVSAGTTVTVQNLAGFIGQGKNTVAAMKIVSLMNIELAQRLNQGNMMQGSVLAIEAARALTETAGITD